MIKRFQRIRSEFGNGAFIRILILLVGLFAMSVGGIFGFTSFIPLIIMVIGLLLGFLLKKQIPIGIEYYAFAVSAGLFVYGVILFLGDRFGIGNHWKLVIITVTTVIIFNLQFWSLSDSSVVKTESKN